MSQREGDLQVKWRVVFYTSIRKWFLNLSNLQEDPTGHSARDLHLTWERASFSNPEGTPWAS